MLPFWKKKPLFEKELAANLYAAVTRQSRQAFLFQDYQISDTPFGRFEILALHLALLLRRLKFPSTEDPENLTDVMQELCNLVVADVEESVRALRLSDLKVNHHVKGFVEGFYGRLVAYDKALESGDRQLLIQAIRRNVYGITEVVDKDMAQELADYVQGVWEELLKTPLLQVIKDP